LKPRLVGRFGIVSTADLRTAIVAYCDAAVLLLRSLS